MVQPPGLFSWLRLSPRPLRSATPRWCICTTTAHHHHRWRGLHSLAADPRRVIDGKQIANQILEEIRTDMSRCPSRRRPPHLVMLCAAPNRAIKSYMKMKQRACQSVGFSSSVEDLGAGVSQGALIDRITQHARDPLVDGIIVQLPLPEHIEPSAAIEAVGPDKDVDGLHFASVGKAIMGLQQEFLPCTPAGVLQVLERSHISLESKHVVVVGRSNLVGLPLANLLIGRGNQKEDHKGPTVTVIHSGTVDPRSHTRRADALIVAAGKAGLIDADSVKEGVVLIDVGINHIPDPSLKSGYRLVGDCTEEAYQKASHYTPVPGGIGPMTVAMLMQNTWKAAKRNSEKQNES